MSAAESGVSQKSCSFADARAVARSRLSRGASKSLPDSRNPIVHLSEFRKRILQGTSFCADIAMIMADAPVGAIVAVAKPGRSVII